MRTMTAILAAAAATAVMAACPNQCSGHGICEENDKCACFKQTGTTWRQRVGYTGADCSQRTCPLGVAYDTLSTQRGVEIEPVKFTAGENFSGVANSNTAASGNIKAFAKNPSASNMGESKTFYVRITSVNDVNGNAGADNGDGVKYQWKLAEHDAYSAPVDLLLEGTSECTATAPCELINNGDNTDVTGIYIYNNAGANSFHASSGFEEGQVFSFTFDHQEGRAYEYGSSNNAHQEVECSGRGSCDGATGRCGCFDGFTGEACQRTVCPNDCSGHGICQSLLRFAADAGQTYSGAYDAEKSMGCKCDAGFRGPDCSLVECPSGDDPMGHYGGDGTDSTGAAGPAMDCSGRGLCDYSSGTCGCFKGYFGERCEYQTNFV